MRFSCLRSVVTTPRPSASALASNSQPVCCALTGQLGFGVLGGSPVSPPCVVLCRLVCARNVPKIVLGELIPPIPAIPAGTNAHGEVTEVTWAVSLPPSKRRPALHHAVDLAIALPLPRDSPVLRVTTDRLLTIASWCGKHESSSCVCMCLHSSQQLLVVLHTAQCIRSVAAVTMPSPAAKLKAARRLPKRLRLSGEEPQGDIARMRAEATARYERGESSSSTLHSAALHAGHGHGFHMSRRPRPAPGTGPLRGHLQQCGRNLLTGPFHRGHRHRDVRDRNRCGGQGLGRWIRRRRIRYRDRGRQVEAAELQKPQSGKPEKVACARWQRRHRHCPRCRSDLGPS